MISQKLLYILAESCHEVTKVLSEQVLSEDKKEWKLIDSKAKARMINAVQRAIEKKITDPAIAHEDWMADMIKEGWTHGEEYSEENKTHPCLVHYADLPTGQQTKDELYLAVLKPFYNL
jgi:hypothetical protein